MKPTWLIFDLGGVLVELDGDPALKGWVQKEWLTHPAVQQFEQGKMGAETFARQILGPTRAKNLQDFLHAFKAWPLGLFEGVEALLEAVPKGVRKGCLSNTNEVHWHALMHEMGLKNYLELQLASFQLGLSKPDPAIFQLLIEKCGCAAEEICFLDDHPKNVKAAQSLGIQAFWVQGPNLIDLWQEWGWL